MQKTVEESLKEMQNSIGGTLEKVQGNFEGTIDDVIKTVQENRRELK